MEIVVSLTGLSNGELEDSIARSAAYQILQEAKQDIRESVRATVNAEIAKQVEGLVAAALERTIQPTNAYGEIKGEPVTMQEFIIDTMVKYLKESVDKDGKDGYSAYGPKKTRADWLVERVGIEPIRKGIEAEINAMAVKQKEDAKRVIADIIATKLAGR